MQLKQLLKTGCLPVCACFLFSCAQPKQQQDPARAVAVGDSMLGVRYQPINDSCIALLRNGDIVLRRGRDLVSRVFRALNTRDQTYSHAGIIQIEHGYPFVYHCIEDPARPGSGMHRDSLSYFIAPDRQEAWGAVRYDVAAAHSDSMRKLLLQYYSNKPAFDRNFDLATDQELYCTEMIYKVYCRAAGDTALIPLSQHKGKIYVGVDDLSANKHTQTICRVRYKQ
jgi:hypothetical protein